MPHGKASAIAAARAIDGLQRGWPVRIIAGDHILTILPAETASIYDDVQGDMAGDNDLMLISAARAATLKIINQRDAATSHAPVMVQLPQAANAQYAMAIADPALDLRHPMKGPFRALPIESTAAAEAAMELARHAGLLPAFLVLHDIGDPPELTVIDAHDVAAYADAARLRIAASARLPISVDQGAHITAFRSTADHREHIALIIGTRDSSPPLVRLHSECLTGDILGSLKCDCGPQLDAALTNIADAGWGILLYLRQEGRAIGLINKLRAYQLQDQGFDTVEANNRLGFATDARDFGIAAQMLNLLGARTIRLLTNNPDKVAKLEEGGITVAERLPLITPDNPHNKRYLDTKRDRTGHII